MMIIAISDIHGRVEAIERAGGALSKADLVLITGDLTHFGKREDAKEVIERARRYSRRVFAVPGNCDYSEAGSFLYNEGISLDGQCTVIENYAIIGLGGSLPCPGRTPNEYTEDDFSLKLEELKKLIPPKKPCILVTHQPPYGTLCDSVSSGSHVGSRAIRSFIIDTKPILCLSGHIHEARGVDTIGMTKVANPGPLFHGGYVLAYIEREKLAVSLVES